MPTRNIKDFTLKELEEILEDMGERRYRARQIFFWVYRKGAHDFSEMKNLPAALIEKLRKNYNAGPLETARHFKSADGTEKILFRLPGPCFIETVLVRAEGRKTVCISTQVGCKYGCLFCASGKNGFTRNLAVSEIIGQILHFRKDPSGGITNYVFMGMGEPLDNYDNLIKAIKIMNDKSGMAIGARRITVSTCGLIPPIEKLQNAGLQVNLSVSLHAADNKLRERLMPVNSIYPLEKLTTACKKFIDKTRREITLEYVMIKNLNISAKNADSLGVLAKALDAKINLIHYSPIQGVHFEPAGKADAAAFMSSLRKKKLKVTLRESKGGDINAACGQLSGNLYTDKH
ncbi:MAG: 23S rRNA (adenine(2503)-C(2))-methyltransferase RlmN [Candidatus Omnitrophica bacterium]|nr:23S rRNA (adenine(2503)-C(2))-methyltransferase RlmN [Candidatus Omnitrophota bacterium]